MKFVCINDEIYSVSGISSVDYFSNPTRRIIPSNFMGKDAWKTNPMNIKLKSHEYTWSLGNVNDIKFIYTFPPQFYGYSYITDFSFSILNDDNSIDWVMINISDKNEHHYIDKIFSSGRCIYVNSCGDAMDGDIDIGSMLNSMDIIQFNYYPMPNLESLIAFCVVRDLDLIFLQQIIKLFKTDNSKLAMKLLWAKK